MQPGQHQQSFEGPFQLSLVGLIQLSISALLGTKRHGLGRRDTRNSLAIRTPPKDYLVHRLEYGIATLGECKYYLLLSLHQVPVTSISREVVRHFYVDPKYQVHREDHT